MNLKQVAIALDQTLNTLVGDGFADETLSARAWRNHRKNPRWARARQGIDAVFGLFGEKQHCFESYRSEVERKQLPDEYGICRLSD